MIRGPLQPLSCCCQRHRASRLRYRNSLDDPSRGQRQKNLLNAFFKAHPEECFHNAPMSQADIKRWIRLMPQEVEAGQKAGYWTGINYRGEPYGETAEGTRLLIGTARFSSPCTI